MLAELYCVSGLTDRAKKHLKTYKKSLDPVSQKNYIKLANMSMQLIDNPKTTRYNWDELWIKKEELEKIKTESTETKASVEHRVQEDSNSDGMEH